MEFIINQAEWSKAVSEVSRAVSGKATNPILTGIKIEAKQNSLNLVGSNNDMVIEKLISTSEKLEIIHTGSIVVSAKHLNELIKKLPNDMHVMLEDNLSVKIKSNEIITTLSGFDAGEYPVLPEIDHSDGFQLTSEELKNIVKHTVFATSKNETKPVLTGVHFTLQNNSLICVATNSQRLSFIKHSLHTDLNESFILPSITLSEVGKLYNGYSSEIDVFIKKSTIVFKSSNLAVYSKLIDGKYPSTSSLIPEESKTTLIVNTKDLLNAIYRASIFASESRNNNVKIQLYDDSKIIVSSNSSSIGQIEETMKVKHVSGDKELSITFDGNYMKDALVIIDQEEIMLCFNGSFKPIVLIPRGKTSNIQLISPVRA
ncbi:DNA polymerase III subunit beta [Ornithinibacillus bavariensis]|uniref:Beta sliding clamp n=1 Tax=Ornithinibacillus bavariensis TaxID=545502 RepID=A0A919X9N2_9BACI|nr:DNA polymerase III subunit beta [Ornithinibacillus bavariensis]GIO28596.1 DNA polymerase III subunit beta [Ornithinibacillus bavariensis]